MKVLHILYAGLGGHGNVFFSMVDADKQKEFEYGALFFGIEDVREGYIKKATERNIPWFAVKKKPGIDLASYKKIVGIIRQYRPDIIFIHTSAYIFPAKWAAFFSRKKIKVVVRETQPNHLKSKFEKIGLMVALLVADKVVFLTSEFRDEVQKKHKLLFSKRRTTVIANGIDLSLFKPAANTATGVINIGMQSRLAPVKDHTTLLKAFVQLLQNNAGKKLQLNLAGDGESREALQQEAASLGIKNLVSFPGMLEEKELPGFINAQDIYVHATQGEMMSTAIMQVMACGKPVIASDVFGVNNMIKDGVTGILVPVKDAGALAAAVQSLLDHPAKATALAAAGYDFALHHFSNEMMLQRYKQVFAE